MQTVRPFATYGVQGEKGLIMLGHITMHIKSTTNIITNTKSYSFG